MIRAVSVLVVIIAVLVSSEVVQSRRHGPAGWDIKQRAAADATVRFTIALKQQHLDVLEAKFWAVSNPQSAEYQNFMSIDEVLNIIAPKAEDVTFVTEWLQLHGVKSSEIKSLGDALEVSTSVKVAENLFDTQFFDFVHKGQGMTLLRQVGSITIPDAVRSRVDLIAGLSQSPPLFNRRYKTRRSPSYDSDAVIPQTAYNLYNIGPQKFGNATSITSQGVIEFEDSDYSSSDLQNFASHTGIQITPLSADHIVGENTDIGTEEGNLDIQFISAVNTEATNWFWIEDDTAWLYTFSTHFFNTADVPLVVSISYGWWEADQCEPGIGDLECYALNITNVEYFTRVNTEFQKIGLRGISLVAASGDNGAHTWSDESCVAPQLRVDFPASSPYVTSVGATQLVNTKPFSPQPSICVNYMTCMASGTEVAVSYPVSGFGSGGGFSAMGPQPSYQADAVKAYLNSGVPLPPAHMYNASGRAHPDVSAVGHNALIWHFAPEALGGTSVSAPIVAAIISMLNQASIAKSGKPLGFVNPLFYQIFASNPSAFNDVTVGDNYCPATEYICASSCTGFNATKGWDAVTGLGSPNYGALLNYIQTH